MKAETEDFVRLAIRRALERNRNAAIGHMADIAMEAAVAAIEVSAEYKALVADAEIGRSWIWQFSENNDDATPETFRALRARTQAIADEIDAARGEG